MRESIATLEDEATERGHRIDSYAKQLEESRAAMNDTAARVSEAQQDASRAREELYRAHEQTELERLRAIADVTRKWEEREARLVRRLEELEREARTERVTHAHTSERINADDGEDPTPGGRTDMSRRYVTIDYPLSMVGTRDLHVQITLVTSR